VATEVFYVRHGEIAAKVPGDPGLSPAGVTMAGQVGEVLAVERPAGVWSSPLARAAETASAVAAACGLDPTVDPRLRERLNWGDVPGQPFDEFVQVWDRCTADRHHVPADRSGRSACQAGCEVLSFVDEIVADDPRGPVVLVAHGGLLVDLLLCLADSGRAERVAPDLDVSYCSISRLAWTATAVEVVDLAVTSHLCEVRTTRLD
jgi:2,3-bisphosphoglycerate-dependent phosphoglycerate mutase